MQTSSVDTTSTGFTSRLGVLKRLSKGNLPKGAAHGTINHWRRAADSYRRRVAQMERLVARLEAILEVLVRDIIGPLP
jgi:hypothetical protein